MAFRIVRRSSAVPRSLTAASQLLTDPATQLRQGLGVGMIGRADWQNQAWDMYDAVGELRYYVGWRSSSCSRVRLVASEIDPETGIPTGNTENTVVRDIVLAMAGGPLGQAQLIKRAVQCLTVVGETWIAILMRNDGVSRANKSGTWLALSREEIVAGGRTVTIELPTGVKHEMNLGRDSIFRVWNPRPRRAIEADSPVRATMDSLYEIVRTTKTISNASKSRLIGNGVVFVPQEMSLPSMQSPVAQMPDEAVGDDPLVFEQTPAVQQLQDLLYQVAQVAYDDEDSMAALIPMFAAVPGEHIAKVSHLKFDNQVSELAIKTRNDAITRLAMGLDVTPERLLGLGKETSHWGAWQIGDDDVRLHIDPPVELICNALTDCVLHPILNRMGLDPEKYVVWYDASVLTMDPDQTDEATAAFDRGTITAEAYRDFLKLGDTGYEFDKLEGWQQWARDQVSRNPNYMDALLPLIPELQDVMEAEEEPESEDEYDEEYPEELPEEAVPAGTVSSEKHGPPATENREPSPVAAGVIDALADRAIQLAQRRRGGVDVDTLIRGYDAMLPPGALATVGLSSQTVRNAVVQRVTSALTSTAEESRVASSR